MERDTNWLRAVQQYANDTYWREGQYGNARKVVADKTNDDARIRVHVSDHVLVMLLKVVVPM